MASPGECGSARVEVIVFASSMALGKVGLAVSIVNLAFGLTLGTVAVASAIAFGLGGVRSQGKN